MWNYTLLLCLLCHSFASYALPAVSKKYVVNKQGQCIEMALFRNELGRFKSNIAPTDAKACLEINELSLTNPTEHPTYYYLYKDECLKTVDFDVVERNMSKQLCFTHDPLAGKDIMVYLKMPEKKYMLLPTEVKEHVIRKELMIQKLKIVDEQDPLLHNLHLSIKRLKKQGQLIGVELDQQNELLEELGFMINKTMDKIDATGLVPKSRRMKILKNKNKQKREIKRYRAKKKRSLIEYLYHKFSPNSREENHKPHSEPV